MPDRLPFSDPLELLIASPLHLLAGLVLVTACAFRARRNGLRRWRFPLLALTAWAWLTMTPVVAHALAASLESRYAPPELAHEPAGEAVVVVLASGDPFDADSPDVRQLNAASLRRTLAAAVLWERIGGELVILGPGRTDDPRSVTTRMAGLARRAGVPAAAIRVVPGSSNTRQNLRDLDPRHIAGRQVFLVTSAVHMPRAMAVAQKLNFDSVAVPCDYRAKRELGWQAWLPNNATWPLLKLALHEIVGMWYYRLRGWA